MTIYGDVDEEIRQRFAMLHLAWDEAYWTRKVDPTLELRSYLHILGGVNAIWKGVMESKHYHRVSPLFELDGGLTTGLCRCICDIMINTHPDHTIPESLAGELQAVSIDLLKTHTLYDANPDKFVKESFENVIHILNLKTNAGWNTANDALIEFEKHLTGEYLADEYQDLIDHIGPSLEYVYSTSDEDFVGPPDNWANDLYRDQLIDQFEHMSCQMCWGPNSPEVIANKEIKEREARKKNKSKE